MKRPGVSRIQFRGWRSLRATARIKPAEPLVALAALVIALGCASKPPPAPEKSPFEFTAATYILRLAGAEVGRESVTFTSTGWTAKGSYDFAGVKKGEYEAELNRAEGKILWKLRSKSKQEIEIESVNVEGKLTARKMPDGPGKTIDVPADAVYWENLVWATADEVARDVTRRAGEGSLIPAAKIPLVFPSVPATFEFKVIESNLTSQAIRGKSAALWNFKIDIGGTEILLVCAPNGHALRIAVPAQQVEVFLEGFEEVALPVLKPVTILDSGEWRKRLSTPKHPIASEKKVLIPVRDGSKLAADVYRPKAEGKFPAVLVRTPYGRGFEGLSKGNFFAPRGYALVAQDVRGRGESEGEWFPFRHEVEDGSDTIDWIAAQPWCDGNVGMIGASYVGVVQWYAAKSGNPHLKAIVPEVSPPDPDQNIPYQGGVFLLATFWWAVVLESESIPKLDWNSILKTLPLTDLRKAFGLKHSFVNEWLEHPPTDSAYWEPFRYQPSLGRTNVAALHLSGWYDGDQPGAPQNFVALRKAGRKDQYLVMGPWTHFFNSARKLGDVDFGPEAVIDLDALVLRFFDKYLKGVDTGIDRDDPVAVFVMGENRWHRERDWPLPQTVPTRLYFGSGGHANRIDGDGRLALAAGAGPADVYAYDPSDIAPSIGDFNDLSGADATADYSKLPDRDDALKYTSRPLAHPCELTGPFRAVLSVSTDAADTDFAVEVFRVAPDGRMTSLAGGIQRLRYRTGRDEPAKPGEVVSVEIDCWASGRRLEKGDRLRVEICSTLFPGYARNLNTLEPATTAKTPVVAKNRVYHDKGHPSYLLLPVVPREDAPGLKFD